MVQLAPRFVPLLAFCLFASATPILNPLDPFVSLSAGVAQPQVLGTPGVQHGTIGDKDAQTNHTARDLPVSVPVDVLKASYEQQNTNNLIGDKNVQANHTARALAVSAPVDGHEQSTNTSSVQHNADADKDAQASPVTVLVNILKNGHEQENTNTSSVHHSAVEDKNAQTSNTPRAVPVSVPLDFGHEQQIQYIPSMHDNDKNVQTVPGQGSPRLPGNAKRQDDGKYHPNPAYDDGKYHPNPAYDDGQYHWGKPTPAAVAPATVAPAANPDATVAPSLPYGLQAVPSAAGLLLDTTTVTETSETTTPSTTATTTAVTSATNTPAAAADRTIAIPALLETAQDAIADTAKVDKRDDGQYHPDPNIDNGLYHPDPNIDDGQYHPKRFDGKRGLVHQGKVRAVRRRAMEQ